MYYGPTPHHKARWSISGIWLACFMAACGGGQPATTSGTGGDASGGAPGADTGGSTGVATGGGSGTATGGEPGTVTGGASGTATGGGSGTPTGGTSGATGGATASGGRQGGGAPGTGGSSAPGTGGGTATPEPKLITSGPNAYWKEGTPTELTSGTADLTVNDATTYQTWSGFGGTFNEVGWDVLSLLSASERDRAMKLLFDAKDGAAFAHGRVPIGASDYATNRYTLNDTANDTTMANFSIQRDKQKLIPYIKAALALRPDLHLWASPWSPPAWMKSNNALDGGNMKDDAQVLKAHAIYLARFVEDYGKEGVKIEAIHPQNEPGYETRYPSCLWTPALMTKFIGTYLGPTFTERNVTAQIYLGTMSNNDSGKDGSIMSTVLGDATASKYVKGFGLQWNMLPTVAGLMSRNLPIVQSEHKCGNYPWNPSGLPAFNPNKAPNDHPYAAESWGYIRDWIKAGVNVYSAWNMVLDSVGNNLDTMRPWPQNALLTVDRTAKTLTVTPVYYVFRHLSQYVDPGAKRVATTGSADALAFKNPDGSIVTIIYNSGTAAKKTILGVGTAKLQFDVPANGWATVNWR